METAHESESILAKHATDNGQLLLRPVALKRAGLWNSWFTQCSGSSTTQSLSLGSFILVILSKVSFSHKQIQMNSQHTWGHPWCWLIGVRYQINSHTARTKWQISLIARPSRLMSYDHPSMAACSGAGQTWRNLAGCTELTVAGSAKALCHSQNVWGNEMNSLLASSSLRCQGTLCYQHRWSIILEKSLVRTANNESRRHRPSLADDSLGNYKNEWVPVILSNQMYCQNSGQAIWKPCRAQRPDSNSTVRRMHLWAACFCLFAY